MESGRWVPCFILGPPGAGGSNQNVTGDAASGAGGGGAIVLASSTRIHVGVAIRANGGNGFDGNGFDSVCSSRCLSS